MRRIEFPEAQAKLTFIGQKMGQEVPGAAVAASPVV